MVTRDALWCLAFVLPPDCFNNLRAFIASLMIQQNCKRGKSHDNHMGYISSEEVEAYE